MQSTYKLDELKKKYLTAAETWEDMPETKAEYKKACAELAKLVPDAVLQEKIKDCFGPCLDKHQMQGFINGYVYSLQTFIEEVKGELPKDKTQLSHSERRMMRLSNLTTLAEFAVGQCTKANLICGDVNKMLCEEKSSINERIEEIKERSNIALDYLSKLADIMSEIFETTEKYYKDAELNEVITNA